MINLLQHSLLCGACTVIADFAFIVMGSAFCFSPHPGSDADLVKKAFCLGAGLSLLVSILAGPFGMLGSLAASATVFYFVLRNRD